MKELKRVLFIPDAHTWNRFLTKVWGENNEKQCWEWMASLDKDGYGCFRYTPEKQGRAHRFAYEAMIGPIPKGKQLDHLCKNRRCVNPLHLQLVTPQENTLRGRGPAALNARKIVCKNGHVFDEINTFFRPTGGRSCRICKLEVLRKSRARRKTCLV